MKDDGELRRGWPAVLACFATAVFAWGFAFYGQAVYLAELQRLNGWSASLISSATTFHYLAGAVLLTMVHKVGERFGPRALIVGGALLLAAGAIGISRATAPWQLFVASFVLAAGWAGTSLTAISTTLARWFDRRRGLAISLALNGASASGFTVAPALVWLSQRFGLATAVAATAAMLLAVLLPLVLVALRRSPPAPASSASPGMAARDDGTLPAPAGAREAFRIPVFWTVAAPFALALAAQVGFIMHQVAFLLPRLGADGTALAVGLASIAAVLGRVGLGFVIDRVDQRRATAVCLVSQAAALAAMISRPDDAAVLYGGSILFGLSVGNLITLPSLIVQREFAAPSFGLVVGLTTAIGQFTYAFAPGLLGVVHDAFGGYGPAFALCIAFEIAAALVVLSRLLPKGR